MQCVLKELYRQSDYAVELNRLLERNIKQSRCLDIEALCIRAGEKGTTLDLKR